jgi:surfeit locus 1 family protein
MIRFRPYPGLSLATLLGMVILLSLGNWQLHRLSWKTALIAAADTRAHGALVSMERVLGVADAEIEYAHAEAKGEYLAGEVYLFTVLDDGRIGFQVIAPFRLEDGRIILVDRGFVPAQGKLPAAHEAPPSGKVRVTGLIRAAHDAAPFTPKPDIAGRVWYGRDPGAMAAALQVKLAARLILARDAGPPGEIPEGGHTRLTFRNEHLSYAVTWFALAATLLVIYFAFHWSRGRLGVRGSR